MRKIFLIPLCLLILIGCSNKEETSIQQMGLVLSIKPISNNPGDVTVISEGPNITYAIFNSVGSAVESKIYGNRNNLTIEFIDTAILGETVNFYKPFYYKIRVDKKYEPDNLIVLVNGEDAHLDSLYLEWSSRIKVYII